MFYCGTLLREELRRLGGILKNLHPCLSAAEQELGTGGRDWQEQWAGEGHLYTDILLTDLGCYSADM